MATNPLENSNIEELLTDQGDLTKNAPKPKFQTKICDHWRRSGNCSYGDSCWYAHGEDDLRRANMMIRRPEEPKTNKENERPVQFRRPSNDDILEMSKPKEDVSRGTTKRTSTNLKGLTVSIPQNITFKEQANESMPLSPAQERWISMSIGGNGNAGEKNEGNMAPPRNDMEHDFDKKMPMENMFEKRQLSGQLPRDDDLGLHPADDIPNFLSPMGLPQSNLSGRLPSSHSTGMFHSQNHPNNQPRSWSRGPSRMSQFNPPQMPPSQPPRLPRGGTGGAGGYLSGAYNSDRPLYGNPHRSASSLRASAREQIHGGNAPGHNGGGQYQQAIWNVAGEIYQRQKDIETVGYRDQQIHQQHQQKKNEEMETHRMLYKLSKMKDMTSLRFLFERGLLHERQVPKEVWMELVNSPPLFNQSLSHAPSAPFGINNNHNSNNNNNNHDCHCGASRPREHSSLHSRFTQSQQSHHHHHHPAHPHLQQHLHLPQSHHHHHQTRRPNQPFPFGLSSAPPELSAPPKMMESLLPSDNSFSIWLDPKPKKETSEFLRLPPGGPPPVSQQPEPSDSSASLLTKMDVLRSEKFPMTAEEYATSNGPSPALPQTEKPVSEDNSTPPSLSLMELLSDENLFEPRAAEKPKTTMFDFDTLKIAETLRMTPPASSHQNLASGKIASPMFFMGEKTPGYEDGNQSGLFTPVSAKKPEYLEVCDFFTAGGSCPFGDGCNLSHSLPKELNAL